MIPKHRKLRIEHIKESLQKAEPLVLVSTQVVEVGVDLDFDIAVRDIGPIDSIAQTAGRCNREGKRKDTDSPFFIYRLVDDENIEYAKRVYGRVYIDIANALIDEDSNILHLVESYYEEIQRRRSNQRSNDVNTAISELDYKKVEESFRLIDQQFKVPVFIEFDEDAVKIWKNFVDTTEPTTTPRRTELIRIRHDMEQYMIGVSETEIQKSNLQVISGIYKVNHHEIDIFYDEITGFISH